MYTINKPYTPTMGVLGLRGPLDLTAEQQGMAAGASALGMGGAALYASAIAGFSSGSWSGAATGAFLGAGVTGITYGAVLGMGGAWVPALFIGGLGTASLIYGGMRSYRAVKRGRP